MPMDEQNTPEDEAAPHDDPPPFVLCWPMEFAQYVKSESARS